MIKYLSTRHLAVIASLLVMMTATAAEDFWFNDLHYVVTGNNTVALASHPDNPYAYSGEVIIPESVTGDNGVTYTVTAIADSAFADSNLQYVFGFPGSAAESFANAHTWLTFVPIDNEWISSH